MVWITGQLNTIGRTFLEYAIPMQIESAILIGLALVLEFTLRKAVRPSVRYLLVTCTLTLIFLSPLISLCPPSICLPTGSAAYADPTTHTGAARSHQAAVSGPWAAKGVSPTQSTAPGDPGYTGASPSRPTTGQSQTAPVEAEKGDPRTRISAFGGPRPNGGLAWPGAIFLAWLSGIGAMSVALIGRAVAARRRVEISRHASPLMTDILSYCRRRMAVHAPVQLKIAPAGTAPALCGLVRPTILVPSDLAPTLGSGHLRTLLLHQLAHVRRHDLWVNLAQNIVTVVYFYNPFVWMANRALRRLRDQAAAEAVLGCVRGERRWYDQRLADVAALACDSSSRLGLVGLA
jgi:beta-lactamase regulating signal transducer with metallopeptidase domain